MRRFTWLGAAPTTSRSELHLTEVKIAALGAAGRPAEAQELRWQEFAKRLDDTILRNDLTRLDSDPVRDHEELGTTAPKLALEPRPLRENTPTVDPIHKKKLGTNCAY